MYTHITVYHQYTPECQVAQDPKDCEAPGDLTFHFHMKYTQHTSI